MTIAYYCILIAALLPILCAGIAKAGAKHFDNNAPREWLGKQDGYRKRANAAQANSWEAFPFFAVAVLVALQRGTPGERVALLAAAFIALRILYIGMYLADYASLRSLVWAAGLAVSIALFFATAW